ncbi:5-methyltetrahydropteroyltriglutamate--homocysteine S-methyltransferase [Candidatus Haliotispira prima]|uniref:5-methyltetrahydropteroyltriglutamate--homocysteine methyltransferase n=1 Tax=Candidatus Haliotispira prima TaxID=3034016 RepID=A0ABY8MJ75_9SPIO|nr:5-methyltetrahydropteroyltriglutamate--homocysteine S-methyltransferase [Candidatus Haliotispira prima]
MSLTTTVLGYPRIGVKREFKRAQESYWKGKTDIRALQDSAAKVREDNYHRMLEAGISEIPVGDFSFYDHVLDCICMLGAVPQRYREIAAKLDQPLDLFFAMARGHQKDGVDVGAMEMTKWFDTNYHNIVPELSADQSFTLDSSRLHGLLREAKDIIGGKALANSTTVTLRPVILGPVSFLLLSKGLEQPLTLLDKLLPVYGQLLAELGEYEHIQIEEPFLGLDLDTAAKDAYRKAYSVLGAKAKLFVTSYFAPLRENAEIILSQPIETLHIDFVNNSEAEVNAILALLEQGNVKVSAGIVDGRNVWRNKLRQSLALLQKIVARIGTERLIVGSSCSLLHSPADLSCEKGHLSEDVYGQLAFARQKLDEVVALAKGLEQGEAAIAAALAASDAAIEARKNSEVINNAGVQQRVANINSKDTERQGPFVQRREKQVAKLNLPLFPTTTIGSFPQTAAVRKKRNAFRKGEITAGQYQAYLEEETIQCIRMQSDLDLDVLVHGEFERTDMVEYFGEQLDGLAFTANGWVQSYGSRCVRPPVIYGDVSRPKPMTVDWMSFAQQQTHRPMKAMLTGPITILKWSFVRDDQPLSRTCAQIAFALRDEVLDLEKAGLPIIQIDEPAIREALPLRKADQKTYLDWAVQSFRISAAGVQDETQVHTHMCYSEFNEIMDAIAAMDTDVISIEASRSQLDILKVMSEAKYPSEIGLGVYDIHSPRVPEPKEMADVIRKASQYLENWQVWINPDCGLKTRDWPETIGALRRMVEAAKTLREELA